VYDGSTYKTLDVPGAASTYAFGISGGNVAGFYQDGTTTHGFVYDGSTYKTLNVPGAAFTGAYGIDGDKVAGEYYDGVTHGFVYTADVTPTPAPSGLMLAGIGAVTFAGYFGWVRRLGHQ
jgi:hypothetical protein